MTIIFENTGFSVEYWGRFNEVEFIEHGMQQHVFKDRPDEIRLQLLKQAFQIIQLDIAGTEKKVNRI